LKSYATPERGGFRIADSTVANVLKAHGIEPAPDRQRSQSRGTFLKAHWDSIFATDFTTVEVWTRSGLVTFYVLAVMHLKTRRVQIAGITPSLNVVWMTQVCRSLTDCEDGFLKAASHLIVDRDTSFLVMREYLSQNTDTRTVLLPPKSPNLNAFMERWFRSLKSESFDGMIFFGKRSLERAVSEAEFVTLRPKPDNGATWTDQGVIGSSADDFAWLGGSRVLYSTYTGNRSMYLSEDSGQTWN
jgi:putative transposase